MDISELNAKLDAHELWVENPLEGKQLNVRNENLSCENLSHRDLTRSGLKNPLL